MGCCGKDEDHQKEVRHNARARSWAWRTGAAHMYAIQDACGTLHTPRAWWRTGNAGMSSFCSRSWPTGRECSWSQASHSEKVRGWQQGHCVAQRHGRSVAAVSTHQLRGARCALRAASPKRTDAAVQRATIVESVTAAAFIAALATRAHRPVAAVETPTRPGPSRPYPQSAPPPRCAAGDPRRLVYALDSRGLLCGTNNTYRAQGFDLTDKPNLYYLNVGGRSTLSRYRSRRRS